MIQKKFTLSVLTLTLLTAFNASAADEIALNSSESESLFAQKSVEDVYKVGTVYVTAEKMLKQSLGSSFVTSTDLNRTPVRSDVSELVRTMPGVNLTGNSASGQRGNNRQIDIRGMGPENTLIMIDGRPVKSRNSVRYSWRGERDTRGDSNWVPAEAIESIEVIRGASAARYGSGAMGGVVNIVTKKVSDEFHGWANAYGSYSEDREEGDSYRTGFGISGPLIEGKLGYRLYGSYNKTEADDPDLNKSTDVDYMIPGRGPGAAPRPARKHAAGREGVENTDIGARLAWQLTDEQSITFDTSWSRQSNIYTGDVQNNNSNNGSIPDQLADAGEETNRMTKTSLAVTHEGVWSWGNSRLDLSYDETSNERYPEGLMGGTEGQISSVDEFTESRLKSWRLAGEAEIPLTLLVEHTFTLGMEATRDTLDDPASLSISKSADTESEQDNLAFYIEDSFTVGSVTIVPTLRFDHNSDAGNNLSPGLSAFWDINENWHVKGGIARAYKAPNLYQRNPNYLLWSKGNGCGINCTGEGGCYLRGNEELDPETSVNKEIGIEYRKGDFGASLTYFRNDYKNKVIAGNIKMDEMMGQGKLSSKSAWVYQWDNARKAVVQGLEGNITIPLHNTLTWSTNFTYMDKFEDEDTHNPLSIIPEYTINSMLDWTPTDKWNVNLTFTQFGKQKPREFAEAKIDLGSGQFPLSKEKLDPYSITSLSAAYTFRRDTELRFGVYNVFDKQILRSPDPTSAHSYNQPGRSFYANLKFTY